MPSRKVIVFLPCRRGSQRVPDKNVRPFGNHKFGLSEIKLKQLLSAELIDQIILSTNDERIISVAKNMSEERIHIDIRPEELASSQTSTDDLIRYVPSIVSDVDAHVLWTHVTSPFIKPKTYDSAIRQYFKCMEMGYDSLMSVTKIQKFLWSKEGPINYHKEVEKWPRTQTLDPVFEINSGFFLNSSTNYIEYDDRIGKKPFLFELDSIQSFDIDWEEDFRLGELILKSHEV